MIGHVRLWSCGGTLGAWAVVLYLAAVPAAHAQTTNASIAGTVKDAQEAVLPGATVALVSATKGTETSTVTDELGNFLFPYVPPDTYELRVSLDGFQTLVKSDLAVNANDRLIVGPLVMTIGQVSETITVTAEATTVKPRSGERSFALPSTAIQNIAVNGRSFFGLAVLVPGVIPLGDTPTQVSLLSANGARSSYNNVTIDGVANIDTGDNGFNQAQTNLDAVAEFKVLTSSYQAEYGRAVGAQVQVVTKSGGQRYSGSGYWYGRRSDWNANTWINNRNGTPKTKTSRNDSGFTFGGPVYVPGLMESRSKKAFFFFSQEFQRRKDPASIRNVTVPTELERRGDFSQSVDANGNPYPYIRDYTTGLPCGPTNTSGCFQDGGVLGRIPANRLFAPTQALLGVMPLPNVSGQRGYNYTSQTPDRQPLNQTLVRGDYQLNNNWRATGRLMWHSQKSELAYGLILAQYSIRGNIDTMEVISEVPGYNWLGSVTGVLNNTTSLEISVGSGHNSIDHYTENELLTRTGAGATNLPVLYPNAVQNDMIPNLAFGGGRIGSAPSIIPGQAPFSNFNTTYDIVGNVTKVFGQHTAKAGVYLQHSQKDQSAFANFNGSYDFANNVNNPFDSQHPFANAALGIFNGFNQVAEYRKPKWRYWNVEWFVQDNWRLNDRLTLDYGVRFYYMTPQWDVSKQASNFLPDAFNPAQAVRLFRPAVVDGVRVGYDAATGTVVNSTFIGRVVPGSGDPFQGSFQAGNGIDETLTDGARFKVSPRFGFAYDLTGRRTLIARGGFGILYDRPQGNQVFDLINNPPGNVSQNLTWGRAQDISAALPYNTPVNMTVNVFEWKAPRVTQWNVGVQWSMPWSLVLDVAYVGNDASDQLGRRPLNAPPYGTAYLPSSQDPTRGVSCSGCSGLSAVPGANALPTDFLRPYQGYGSITQWAFDTYSHYHSLQTSLSRRFEKGLLLTFNYTRSTSKGIAGGDYDGLRIDGQDREANYGPTSLDRPHVIAASWVYQAPKLVDNRVLGVALNDWQISGLYRYMSGAPYGVGFSIAGIGAVNLTGSDQNARIVLTGDPGQGWSDDPYRQFNTAVFQAPSAGSNGLESPRVYMNLPPTNNLDLSLSKSFRLGGTRRFELRIDAFNALNTVQFSSINTTANFSGMGSTTITNLPYDASGNLVNRTGFGTVSGTRPARQLQVMTRFSF